MNKDNKVCFVTSAKTTATRGGRRHKIPKFADSSITRSSKLSVIQGIIYYPYYVLKVNFYKKNELYSLHADKEAGKMKKMLIAFMAVLFVMTSVVPTMARPRKKADAHRGGYGREFYGKRGFEGPFEPGAFYYGYRERTCDQGAYYDIREARRTVRELSGLIYDLKTLKHLLDGRDRPHGHRHHGRNRPHGHGHHGRNRHWR
jgi:hypothetical protein